MSITNQFKTAILLGLLTGLLLWIGSFWGQSGLFFALIFSILMNFFAYWFSDKIALAIYRAKPVTEKEAPKLYKIVKEVAKKAGIPMPKVYIIPGNWSNAMATGRNKKHAAVAATQGILNLLNEEELKGVIAHEISHIKNNDILIQSVAATIAGVIGYIAMMARYAAIFGGSNNRDRRGGSGLELIVLAIITPILATLIRLAISRSREYIADESGAKLVEDGKGLASALEKLESDVKQKPLMASSATETTAHMMILSPFGKMGGLVTLFSTHPEVKSRVQRLKSMKF